MGFEIGKLTRLQLGYVGENASRTIEIDVSEWQTKWPDAMIAMTVQRPTEDDLYIPATEVVDGILKWEVVQSDVAIAGKGLAQVRAVDSGTGKVYISRVVGTIIEPSMRGTTDTTAPDKSKAWVDQVLGAVGRVEDLSAGIKDLINMSVSVHILPAGSDGYAEYADGVLTIYIPKGDKGEPGSAAAVKVNGVEGVDDNITITGDDVPLSAADETSLSAAVVKRDRVRNLLDNSDFTNPVNQRGWTNKSSVAAKKYFLDRWMANAAVTPELTSDGISASAEILQMTRKEGLVGKTVTGALCLSDGTLVVGSGVVPSGGEWVNIVDIWHNDSRLLVTSASEETLRFRVVCGSNTVRWAALYEGAYTADTLPAYQPKGYAAELMECQRYYIKYTGGGRMAGFCTTTTMYIGAPLTVPMRVTPTLTVLNLGSVRVAGKSITPTGLSLGGTYGDNQVINVAYASASGIGNYVGVWAGSYELSADYQL